MRKLLLSFQFLTIIPLRDLDDVSDEEMGRSVVYFPLTGFIEGLLLAVSAVILQRILTAEVTNALLILLLVILNGGLHLDGLADTFDATASRADRERKLLIMKDSTVGPAGVAAIVMALLLKYVLLNSIYFHSGAAVYNTVLLVLPVVSRWSMVAAAYYGKAVRKDGLGKVFIEHTGAGGMLFATLWAVSLGLAACAFTAASSFFAFYLMFVLPLLFMFSRLAVWFFHKRFSGMTGDTFGAVDEITKMLFLLLVNIWLQQSV